jgi:hypothetical protein
MEIHPEKLARDAIVNILKGNPQDPTRTPVYPIEEVQNRIFPNRPTPLGEEELPAICVYAKTTYIEDPKGNSVTTKARMTGVIEVMLEDLESEKEDGIKLGVDDQIDAIFVKVWNLLSGNRSLVDPVIYLAKLTEYSGDRSMAGPASATLSKFTILGDYTKELLAEGTKIIGSGKIPFEAEYDMPVLDDIEEGIFDTLHAQWQSQEANNTTSEAEDHITNIHQEV